ncbi:MAG: hypothetical protein AAF471_07620 [Myxococcota bacterium]
MYSLMYMAMRRAVERGQPGVIPASVQDLEAFLEHGDENPVQSMATSSFNQACSDARSESTAVFQRCLALREEGVVALRDQDLFVASDGYHKLRKHLTDDFRAVLTTAAGDAAQLADT